MSDWVSSIPHPNEEWPKEAEADNAPFETPDDYRMAAKCARQRNQKAVRARLAGDVRAAREHQSYADWLIARARMWRNAWEEANG